MTEQERLDTLINGSSETLRHVHPVLSDRVYSLINDLASSGLYFGANMGFRSRETQAALYAQGRLELPQVNSLRKVAGLPAILPADNLHKVTQLKISFHNLGLAVDLVEDGNPDAAGIQWSWSKNADYLKIGPLAKENLLEWGGFWTAFKDLPHVQLTCGMSINDAIMVYDRQGQDALWAQITKRLP